MKPESVKKILVIRFSSLGDVILTTPLLKFIKKSFPNSKTDFLVKDVYADVLLNNPNIDNLISAADDLDFRALRELKKTLKLNSYDLILDAHNNLRSFYIRQFLAKQKFVFRKYSFRKFLLVKLKINKMSGLPSICERYCSMLNSIEGCSAGGGLIPELFESEEASKNVLKILQNRGINDTTKLVVVIPSAKHFTKTYPPECYTEVINRLINEAYTIVLTGKGKDKANIDVILKGTNNNAIDLCNKLSLLELIELMKLSRLVIGGDTGPLHIAEAFNKPLIMLAGSSVSEFGFYPQNKKAVVLENNSLNCRPCSHIGRNECPLGHFKCMIDISPEEVFQRSISQLN